MYVCMYVCMTKVFYPLTRCRVGGAARVQENRISLGRAHSTPAGLFQSYGETNTVSYCMYVCMYVYGYVYGYIVSEN